MKISKEDAIILDEIISIILSYDNPITIYFLMNDDRLNLHGTESEKESEISRLLSIIQSYGIATCIESEIYPSYIVKNNGMRNFSNKGGFDNIHQVESKRISDENEFSDLTTKKLKIDLTIAKWQKITFWPVLIGGAIGFILGIVNTVDGKSKTKSIEVLQQDNLNIQTEVSRLRILILDRENADSLRNPTTETHVLRK